MNIKLRDEKNWNVSGFDIKKAEELSEMLTIPLIVAKLLVIRGIDTIESAKGFLCPESNGFNDPYLLNDMDKAVFRIEKAITTGERVLIYGDYDVDGISSVSVLYLYLHERGANVCYYIPERISEGYGLNNTAIDRFKRAGISLIITVDTGITAIDEAKYAKECGMDIIITDHHECRQEIPMDACAVINPKRRDSKYPFSELAGVGVVFKLICALDDHADSNNECEKYLDIVALGTIADVMTVYGENRYIILKGLEILNSKRRVGIDALLACALNDAENRRITSTTVGFTLSPRLNAAGRIGDVKLASELLITPDANRAHTIATQLCELNKERQNIENKILSEAISMIEGTFDFEIDRVIVLGNDGWHQGVIGIVASRLTDKYGLPSILVTFSDGIGKGSARSIKGFNMNDALVHCSDYLIKSGGHELAAGLSVEKTKFEEFRSAINEYAYDILSTESIQKNIEIDLEVEASDLDLDHAQMISRLEPYGHGNPAPIFMLKNASVASITPIGGNKHLRVVFEAGDRLFNAVYFNKTVEDFPYLVGFSVDVAFNLEINEFKGVRSIQMNIKDMRLSDESTKYINRQAKEYLRAIAMFIISPDNLPNMQTFRSAFIYLRNKSKVTNYIDIYKTAVCISGEFSSGVTPCMLNIMLDIFSEMGLMEIERDTLNDVTFKILDVDAKVNLEASSLLTKLRMSQT